MSGARVPICIGARVIYDGRLGEVVAFGTDRGVVLLVVRIHFDVAATPDEPCCTCPCHNPYTPLAPHDQPPVTRLTSINQT
ncbi:hypothetical protein KHQ06_24150 [Nocardia tengchongensis]|uniref:Uncharacterized protein n=1 Tax=Nocardia tengchongensis TaxID=2055889 RepID=A0ABX8CHL2_9NOCA|nr:hypothetical protein [Nocardia tengchongensis]QVI19458.1 hypothetical protein KHQ06_24150 [Nocardia tengchongensis]